MTTTDTELAVANITLAGSTDTLTTVRNVTRHGRQYIVVPVVALVGDIVVNPLNSRGGEFIPADVLPGIARTLNGRPVVHRHPQQSDGRALSANDPQISESYEYGTVYNARVEDGRIKAEMWIEPSRAAAIGAQDVVDRISRNELVEVSVGTLTQARNAPGTHNGKSYSWHWQAAIGDHLATLPPGHPGACSVAAGCGAPRSLSQNELVYLAARGLNSESSRESIVTALAEYDVDRLTSLAPSTTARKAGAWSRLLASIRELVGDDTAAATRIIKAIAPTIHEHVPDVNTDATDTPDSAATVETQVAASENVVPPITVAGDVGGRPAEGEPCMCQSKDLAERLIANTRSPFVEEDRATLEAFSVEKLTSLEDAFKADPSPQPTPTPAPENPPTPSPGPAPTPTPKVQTTDELLAEHPEIKAVVDAHNAHLAQVRNTYATAILPKTNGAYSLAQLQGKPVDELRQLARAFGLDTQKVDFSLLGLATQPPASPNTEQPRKSPDAWGIGAKKSA